jgi:transposase
LTCQNRHDAEGQYQSQGKAIAFRPPEHNRRVKASHEELREALRGRVTNNHRFLLRLHLNQIDALDAAVATVETQVEGILGPFQTTVEQVMSVPGIKNLRAQVIISEIGTDMSRFPSDQHLISWAGICPRNDESAGKRRSNRLRKGAPWLKTALVQCAWAAKNKKDSYLQAHLLRDNQKPALSDN